MRAAHIIGVLGTSADAEQEMAEQAAIATARKTLVATVSETLATSARSTTLMKMTAPRIARRPGQVRRYQPCGVIGHRKQARPALRAQTIRRRRARPKLAIAVATIRPFAISMMRWGIRLKPSMMKTTPATTAGSVITVRNIVISARNACAKRVPDIAGTVTWRFTPACQHERARSAARVLSARPRAIRP
jgi:hypothetical protein